MGDLHSGFDCKCGDKVIYPPWVYAHWDEALVYTCPKCGARYALRRGVATPDRAKKRGKKKADPS